MPKAPGMFETQDVLCHGQRSLVGDSRGIQHDDAGQQTSHAMPIRGVHAVDWTRLRRPQRLQCPHDTRLSTYTAATVGATAVRSAPWPDTGETSDSARVRPQSPSDGALGGVRRGQRVSSMPGPPRRVSQRGVGARGRWVQANGWHSPPA